jgi:hypothetical protein
VKRIALTSLCACALAAPVIAQWPVIDTANLISAGQRLVQLQQQYSQLVTTYNRITQQYNQAVYMAQYLRNMTNYRIVLTPWQGMTATNTSGTTLPWLSAINSGLNTSGAWLNSTFTRPQFSSMSALIPTIQRARAQMEYGTLELQDGTAQSAMTTIGALRSHGAQSEAALNSLEGDSFSTAPDMNTTAALLNKINAAAMVSARTGADTNKLLVSQAEMHLVEMKERHDAEAAAVANEIAFRTTGMATLRAQHAGFSDAMRNFQIQ